MSHPFISFLTTAYGTERYVGETIDSVLAQTRTDWELIVVDNGNSEEMARVVGKYTGDSRIKLVRQENKGVRGGVTAAADVAVGRYLCTVNSDDMLHPDFCERVGALIDAAPGVDAVGCDAERFPDPDDGTPPEGYFETTGRRSVPDPSRAVSLAEFLDEGVPLYIGAFRRIRPGHFRRRARRRTVVARGRRRSRCPCPTRQTRQDTGAARLTVARPVPRRRLRRRASAGISGCLRALPDRRGRGVCGANDASPALPEGAAQGQMGAARRRRPWCPGRSPRRLPSPAHPARRRGDRGASDQSPDVPVDSSGQEPRPERAAPSPIPHHPWPHPMTAAEVRDHESISRQQDSAFG